MIGFVVASLVVLADALPTVSHSVWKAPDGQVAAVLVNRTRKAQSYRLETPDMKAEGVLPPLSWKKIPAPPTARTSRPDAVVRFVKRYN